MIRSSKISLKYANTSKSRIALQICIDHIWSFKSEDFDIENDLLNLPKFLNYKNIDYNGKLSARALCSALQQANNIVRGNIKKRSQLL